MGRRINSVLEEDVAPFISGDGKRLLYSTQDTRSGKWYLKIAEKAKNGWSEPEEIDIINKWQHLNQIGGYCLSFDGKSIFFSTKKHGGVGNYDIWVSHDNGNYWTVPQNLAKPINTISDEVSPSISANGKYLYFGRTTGYNNDKPCVEIYRSELYGTQTWTDPVKVSNNIKGCIGFPKILSDGRTLLYSKKASNTSHYDFYISKDHGKGFKNEKEITSLNTDSNNFFATIGAKNSTIYFQEKKTETNDLFMALLDEEYRPDNVMQIKGRVADSDDKTPLEAIIQAFDLNKNLLYHFTKTDSEGNFRIVIPEGVDYDFSIMGSGKNHSYYAKHIDITSLKRFSTVNIMAELDKITRGEVFNSNIITHPDSVEGRENLVNREFFRIQKLMEFHPELTFEVAGYIDEWEIDTIQSELLSEKIVMTYMSNFNVSFIKKDGCEIGMIQTPKAPVYDTIIKDTIVVLNDTVSKKISDTIYRLVEPVELQTEVYHNNKSSKIAKQFVRLLEEYGMDKSRLKITGYCDKKRRFEPGNDKNNRIEIRFR